MNETVPAPRPPLWLLVLITFSGTLAMHMFVPALPAAARDLGAGTGAMQLTISLYVLGLAFGQLVYGPLSDAFGRRPVLMVGLTIYTLSGLAALLAPGVQSLIAARLFQALGGCAGLVLGRAMVRDTATGDDAVRQMALLTLMMLVGPGLAPLFGGLLAEGFGWRSIFVLLVALGVVGMGFAWWLLPETVQPRGRLSAASLAREYRVLLRSPAFLGFAIGGGCATTSLYAFLAAAPFIFTGPLQRSVHEVGLYLGVLILGMALGNMVTGRLVGRVAAGRLVLGASALSLASAIALLGIVLAGALSVVAAVGSMVVFSIGVGMASPVAVAKAVGVNSKVIGSASGLYGFAQMGVGAVCTGLAGLGRDPALAAAIVLVAAGVVAQVALRIALRWEAPARPSAPNKV